MNEQESVKKQTSVKKLLIGSQAIMDYLGISKQVFYQFIKLGMPAIVINGRWYAWTDNIDIYFQKITLAQMKDSYPEDAE